MADSATGSILSALILCGLMGVLGQGARAAVGLKSASRLPSPQADQQTEFSAAYFVLSLMIGFIAGILAGLAIGIQNILNIDPGDIKVLLGIAASGYAGADFIENSLSIFIPPPGSSTASSKALRTVGASPADAAAPPARACSARRRTMLLAARSGARRALPSRNPVPARAIRLASIHRVA